MRPGRSGTTGGVPRRADRGPSTHRAEVADEVGISVRVAAFHLEKLLSEGFLEATYERDEGRSVLVIRRSGTARPVSSSSCRSRRDGTTSPPRSWPRRWKQTPLIGRWSRSPTLPPSTAVRLEGGRGHERRRSAADRTQRHRLRAGHLGRRCGPSQLPLPSRRPSTTRDHLPDEPGIRRRCSGRHAVTVPPRGPVAVDRAVLRRRHFVASSADKAAAPRRSVVASRPTAGESCSNNTNEYCRYWQVRGSGCPHRHVPPDHADGAAGRPNSRRCRLGLTATREDRDGQTNG